MTAIRTVTRASDMFGTVGRKYAMGEVERGYRWVRPATEENPFPDLESTRWPPTLVPEDEIAFAFDANWHPAQLDLFAQALQAAA